MNNYEIIVRLFNGMVFVEHFYADPDYEPDTLASIGMRKIRESVEEFHKIDSRVKNFEIKRIR